MPVQEVAQAAGQSLYAMAEVDGVLVTPTAMTLSVYVNGGSTVLATATPTASASVMTASLSFADTALFAYNQLFRALFGFTVGGIVYTREVYFTVARIPTEDAIPLSLNDLLGLNVRFDAAITQALQSADKTAEATAKWIIPAYREVRRKLEAAGIQVHTVNPQTVHDAYRYWAAVNMTVGLLASSEAVDKIQAHFESRFREAWKELVIIARPADQQEGVKERGATSQPSFRVGPDRELDNKGIWGPFSQNGSGGPLGRLR